MYITENVDSEGAHITFSIREMFKSIGKETNLEKFELLVSPDNSISFKIETVDGLVPKDIKLEKLCWASREEQNCRYSPFLSFAMDFPTKGEVEFYEKGTYKAEKGKPRIYNSHFAANKVYKKKYYEMASSWWNAIWKRALKYVDPVVLKESRRFTQNSLYHNLRLLHKEFGQLTNTSPASALLIIELLEKRYKYESNFCIYSIPAQEQVKLLDELVGNSLRLPLPTLVKKLSQLRLTCTHTYGGKKLEETKEVDLTNFQVELVRRIPPYESAGWRLENVWMLATHSGRSEESLMDINQLRKLKTFTEWKILSTVRHEYLMVPIFLRNPKKYIDVIKDKIKRQPLPVSTRKLKPWQIVATEVSDYLTRYRGPEDQSLTEEHKLSIETLIERSNTWHHTVRPSRISEYPVDAPFPAQWIKDYSEKELVFKFLKDGRELAKETEEMKHCVWSYSSRVHRGQCQIYSVRDLKDKSIATIEISPQLEVRQASGISNVSVPKKHLNFVERAIEETTGQLPKSRIAQPRVVDRIELEDPFFEY